MNSRIANLINSTSLILIGLWGYLNPSTSQSTTALIPVAFGIGLILCDSGLKNHNKLIAHIAVSLTLIILLALIGMRLPKSLSDGGVGLIRVILMISTSVLAMIYFVKSFIDARKEKK